MSMILPADIDVQRYVDELPERCYKPSFSLGECAKMYVAVDLVQMERQIIDMLLNSTDFSVPETVQWTIRQHASKRQLRII